MFKALSKSRSSSDLLSFHMKFVLLVIIGALLWNNNDARQFTADRLDDASELIRPTNSNQIIFSIKWDFSSPPLLSLSVLTSVYLLSTSFLTFKMQNYKNSAKSIPPSQQIVRKYWNVESNSDWDDIMSPDDIQEYYERRQYEKMMTRYH